MQCITCDVDGSGSKCNHYAAKRAFDTYQLINETKVYRSPQGYIGYYEVICHIGIYINLVAVAYNQYILRVAHSIKKADNNMPKANIYENSMFFLCKPLLEYVSLFL